MAHAQEISGHLAVGGRRLTESFLSFPSLKRNASAGVAMAKQNAWAWIAWATPNSSTGPASSSNAK